MLFVGRQAYDLKKKITVTHSFLTDFKIISPLFQTKQEQCLKWLVAAHTKSEATKQNLQSNDERLATFERTLSERLHHVGCKPDSISFRGHSIPDFTHEEWPKMEVYRLHDAPEGIGLGQRAMIYDRVATEVVEQFYRSDSHPTENLIHVSCTGYHAPSAVQKMISKRKWGPHSTVTHAYHMGCYASLPAVRIAQGFLRPSASRVDIIHTELCTLHNNPSLHGLDQLVAHSLFADGFIRYSLISDKERKNRGGLRVLTVHEEIIPDSLDSMLWVLNDWGFEFTLAREIPVFIMRALKQYFTHLCAKAQLNERDLLEQALFAIHPGGPKILKYVLQELGLQQEQMKYSHTILREHGNMSSATLPHIWELISKDHTVPCGTKIVSLAFGPGLTIAGSIMEKEG